jgi:hypothetical protein
MLATLVGAALWILAGVAIGLAVAAFLRAGRMGGDQ